MELHMLWLPVERESLYFSESLGTPKQRDRCSPCLVVVTGIAPGHMCYFLKTGGRLLKFNFLAVYPSSHVFAKNI